VVGELFFSRIQIEIRLLEAEMDWFGALYRGLRGFVLLCNWKLSRGFGFSFPMKCQAMTSTGAFQGLHIEAAGTIR
jgi:hypothetical protein